LKRGVTACKKLSSWDGNLALLCSSYQDTPLMSDINTYAIEFVKFFGLSFLCPELYMLANLSADTMTLARYAAQHLMLAVAGKRLKDPFAHW
jgi:hypothetical protein